MFLEREPRVMHNARLTYMYLYCGARGTRCHLVASILLYLLVVRCLSSFLVHEHHDGDDPYCTVPACCPLPVFVSGTWKPRRRRPLLYCTCVLFAACLRFWYMNTTTETTPIVLYLLVVRCLSSFLVHENHDGDDPYCTDHSATYNQQHHWYW